MTKRNSMQELEDMCHRLQIIPDGIMAHIVRAIQENNRRLRVLSNYMLATQITVTLLAIAHLVRGCP